MNLRYEVGDIISPVYNGTAGVFKKSRWDIVVKVDDDNRPIHCVCCESYETIRAVEILMKHPELLEIKKKK